MRKSTDKLWRVAAINPRSDTAKILGQTPNKITVREFSSIGRAKSEFEYCQKYGDLVYPLERRLNEESPWVVLGVENKTW